MTKHIIDRPRRTGGGNRLRAFLAIDQAENTPGPRERRLYRRGEQARGAGLRLREYLRIERHHEV